MQPILDFYHRLIRFYSNLRIMKNVLLFVFLFSFLLLFCMCDEELVENSGSSISFLELIPGGCNLGDENALKSGFMNERDTVFFSQNADTITMFVGLEYICCAPFAGSVQINSDTIIFVITDTCNVNSASCYCRCMCYYTWNVRLIDVNSESFAYKIILNDPNVNVPILFREGLIQFPQNASLVQAGVKHY